MASLISEVIKDTIKEATLNKITLTPENYAQLFCKVAARQGLSSPECQKLKAYISKLNESYQKEIANMPIRTESELFAYMSSRLNRANNESGAKADNALSPLVKNILNAIKLLRNKEAKNLANITLSALESRASETNILLLKDKWQAFINSFDDSFVDDLKKFGIQNNDDLKAIVSALTNSNIEISGSKDYYLIAELLLQALLPSLSTNMSDKLADVSKKLRDMPELIENENMHGDIKNLIDLRIGLDREEFKSKISALDKILCDIEFELETYSKKLGLEGENKQLLDIRKDLESLNGGNLDEFKNVKNKLENVASSITTNLKDFEEKITQSTKAIKGLKEEIEELKAQLEKSTKEATSDFLTGLYTKRALEAELERIEEDYTNKNINYCLCFFDIDHFKRVNDTYGHSAGDVILAKVGNILHKCAKDIDIIGRFGGEEFVALLPLSDTEKAHEYAKTILANVSSFEFVYKSTKFSITISCGICARKNATSSKSCMDKADEMLYAAKEAGRNCIKIYEGE